MIKLTCGAEFHYTTPEIAEMIIDFAREHGIEPTDTYTADAGADYGQVEAWELADGTYAIYYGDNSESRYELAPDADDLAVWLIHEDLHGADRIVETANVRGLDALPGPDDSRDEYAILVSHHYYGYTSSHDVYREGDSGEVVSYSTLTEAQEAADAMDEGIYVTEHNEIGRPTYTVVAL
jgi:hypothetical protein